MDKKIKKFYVPPVIEMTLVEMEQGIVVGSAIVKVGSANSQDVPQVEDWEDQQIGGSSKIDF
ncbi:hypothetical protein [Sphingobacterium paludis]|uniref:Uncharacterized protein n=1 Tax=Sphingobacterium paludis TaxID=1476465 RepID=A0A4R7CSU9_9SPHI|nr:hypothetical protein [Sphingobacterium paludis]TDS08932.1 hypothetical protein B0I21_11161 [Sphingobacterium paludis]